jgi:hypothetical protein
MTRHAAPNTCLSKYPHDERISDVRLHYFGCLEGTERQRFFNKLPEHSQHRICSEELRIAQARASLDLDPESAKGNVLREFKNSLVEWRRLTGRRNLTSLESPGVVRPPSRSVDFDIKAPIIFFKDSRPYNVPGVDNEFPHQKIAIKDLLSDQEDRNPLMQPCEENMVRYFHLPANNMIWVEVGPILLTYLTANR